MKKIDMNNIEAVYYVGYNIKLKIENIIEVVDCGEKYLLKVIGFANSYWPKNRVELEAKR